MICGLPDRLKLVFGLDGVWHVFIFCCFGGVLAPGIYNYNVINVWRSCKTGCLVFVCQRCDEDIGNELDTNSQSCYWFIIYFFGLLWGCTSADIIIFIMW